MTTYRVTAHYGVNVPKGYGDTQPLTHTMEVVASSEDEAVRDYKHTDKIYTMGMYLNPKMAIYWTVKEVK